MLRVFLLMVIVLSPIMSFDYIQEGSTQIDSVYPTQVNPDTNTTVTIKGGWLYSPN